MTFTRDLETEGHVIVYVTFLSLLVFILPRWFLCCFVRMLGLGIHSNYRRSRDHHAWFWNWRSRHGLRDFCYFCLYLSYWDEIFCFVRLLVQGIHSNYCQLRDLHAWPWKPKVTSLSTWLFVLSGNSQNEFLDLKTWQNKQIIAVGHIHVLRNNKYQVDHDVTLSFKVIRKSHASGNS